MTMGRLLPLLLLSIVAVFGCRSRPVGGESTPGATEKIALRDPKVARFALLGDSGEEPKGQMQIAHALASICHQRGCDFVVLLGDMLGEDGPKSADDPVFAEKLEAPYASLGVPIVLALGNHDYGGGGAGWDDDVGEHVMSWVSRHSQFRLPTRHFAIDAGPLRMVVLDTNASMYGNDLQQRSDVSAWLAAPGDVTRVVVGHHPYLSDGDHGDAGHYDHVPTFLPVAPGKGVASFFEDVVCDRADLYVAGHDHTRQWLTPRCGKTELAISGAASLVTHIKPRHEARFADEKLGFIYVEATSRSFHASIVGASGSIDFDRTITR